MDTPEEKSSSLWNTITKEVFQTAQHSIVTTCDNNDTMVKTHTIKPLSLFCLLIALASFALPASAQSDDPPSRVARLAYVQGSVSFQPAGTDDWVTAGLNRPLTTGDKLWSDNNGRVELQLGGSLVRLSSNTGFSFLNLSDSVTQIQLSQGTLLVRVQRLDDNESYEIDTPNLAFSVLRPGLYKISVNEAGDSTAVKVRSGDGEATGGGAAFAVHANDYDTFSGTDQLSVDSQRYGAAADAFDNWAAGRDRHWQNSNSAQYVSVDVVGYDDLDDHGSWRRTPDYGSVWFPRTSVAGWAPYHNGHWDYIEPWGYTWVDDEPWGFAPFHYGRWLFYEGSWGWVPSPPRAQGITYVRPVYAPALVAWVGGPHFAIGITSAPGVNVGWFPLGPREVYVPSYRVSRNYVNKVNVSNTTVNTTVVNNYYNTTVVNNNVNVTNVKYVNQGVPGAVTATSPRAFTSAQPVARNAVKVDPREVASAPVRAFTPAAVPVKQAVLGTGAPAARPPAALQTRAIVAKVAPPPPPPPFEKRQEAIRNNGGRPLSVAQEQQITPVAAPRLAPVRIAPAAKTVTPPASPNAGNLPAIPNGAPPTAAPNVPRRADRPPDRSAPGNANPAPGQPVNPPAAQPNFGNRPANPPPAAAQRPDRPPDRLAPGNANPAPGQPVNPPAAQPNFGNRPANPPPAAAQRPDRPPDRPAPGNANPAPGQPVTPPPAQPNFGNRPANPPPAAAQRPDRPPDRPAPGNANPAPGQPNRPAPTPAVHPAELPPPPRIVVPPTANPALDKQHQQEQDQLRVKQTQERQSVQQQQAQEHAKAAPPPANDARKPPVEQQHQQQTQQLQQKQAAEQKQLQDKQQQERQNQAKANKKDGPPDTRPGQR